MSTTQRGARARKLRADAKEWQIGDQTFEQKPLTFFGRNDFMAVAAGAVEQAIGDPAELAALLSSLGLDELSMARLRRGGLDPNALVGAEAGKAVMRLIGRAPGLMEDVFLLALNIPVHQRETALAFLRENLDDDEGFGIFDTFVDQNAEHIERFARRWWESLTRAYQRLRAEDASSPTSDD